MLAVVEAAAAAGAEQEEQSDEQQRLLATGASGSTGSSAARPPLPQPQEGESSKPSRAARMGWRERLQRTAALWPYTVPLMLGAGWDEGCQHSRRMTLGAPAAAHSRLSKQAP